MKHPYRFCTIFEKHMKYVLTFLTLTLLTVSVKAQEARSIDAESPITKIDEQYLYKVDKVELKNNGIPTINIVKLQTSIVSNPVYDKSLQLPSQFVAEIRISKERKKNIAYVFVPQYIKNEQGDIVQLLSYELQIEESAKTSQKTSGARVYAPNSVLAAGNWYKIAVAARGIYKVDYEFVKTKMGIELNGTPSSAIRLYGNGGQLLPEGNAIPRADDLIENAIAMYDGGDGVFNPGDYFLFYANGPHSILKDSINKSFIHQYNIYSDISTYFLQVDGQNGKRITNETNQGTPTHTVVDYNYFYFYEKDSANLGKFGKDWWGEEFSDLPGRFLTRTFSHTVPNRILSDPIYIKARVGAISASGVSTMQASLNGQSLQSVSLNPVRPIFSDPVLDTRVINTSTTNSSNALSYTLQFTKGSNNASGFLDYIEINCRRALVGSGSYTFADWNSVGAGQIANYRIAQANANTQVWDITNPLQPVRILGVLDNNTLSIIRDASILREYVITDGSEWLSPQYIEKTPNQNLHNATAADLIIIAHPDYVQEAQRLASHHNQKRNLRSVVVTPQQVYNEFSSGTQDVTALRDFIKMYYDKAGIDNLPSHVLFFGDASYDYKNRISNNTNFVPTYQTNESLDKIKGYCTDDFFGFLDDEEDINLYGFPYVNTIDMGVGRLTANSISQASAIVSKIIHYDSPACFGPWRNNLSFAADDGDNSIHLDDAELMAGFARDSLPVYNNYKFYTDAFIIQSTPAGPRAPDANKALVAQLFNGTLLMNYNGHGGPKGWCEERIFSMDDINLLDNYNKLPLFITATCDFAPFDNPAINSAGEILLAKPNGGAIALMTTTQLVFADQNRVMNFNYMRSGLSAMSTGRYPSLGDAFRLSKNLRYVSSIEEWTASNFRKFVLLGDPALPLAFPKHKVYTDSINGISVTQKYDTLKALNKYTITGHVADQNGNLLSNFNGIVYPTIFDKPKKLSTLQNIPSSPKRSYELQNNAIYKGKASVKNGKFTFTFVVPKDINYVIDLGKISYYTHDEVEDGNGYDNKIYVGGSGDNPIDDNKGPDIKPYMNDEKFVNGGITTPNSTLLIKLFDENGINYTGNSIGHDITATLDGDPQKTYVLNNFYEADLDSYQSGVVRFPVNNLSEGPHYFLIKAWDVLNNSSEARIDFVVVPRDKGKLEHVYNYPNPFSTRTGFMFEHNMPNQNLHVTINVYTVTGKVVKTIKTTVNTPGTRVHNIEWDGTDQYGDKLANGVYMYKLSFKSATGQSASKIQKLVILR